MNWGLQPSFFTSGQFLTAELCDSVDSLMWRLSGADDYILWITYASSNAQNVLVCELLKRLRCVVGLTTSDYPRLKFDGRKRAIQFFYTMIDTQVVLKLDLYLKWEFHSLLTDFGTARYVQGINLDFISIVMIGFNFHLIEQLENQ